MLWVVQILWTPQLLSPMRPSCEIMYAKWSIRSDTRRSRWRRSRSGGMICNGSTRRPLRLHSPIGVKLRDAMLRLSILVLLVEPSGSYVGFAGSSPPWEPSNFEGTLGGWTLSVRVRGSRSLGCWEEPLMMAGGNCWTISTSSIHINLNISNSSDLPNRHIDSVLLFCSRFTTNYNAKPTPHIN